MFEVTIKKDGVVVEHGTADIMVYAAHHEGQEGIHCLSGTKEGSTKMNAIEVMLGVAETIKRFDDKMYRAAVMTALLMDKLPAASIDMSMLGDLAKTLNREDGDDDDQ